MYDVLICTRGREDFLATTLACVLNQDITGALRIVLLQHEDCPKNTYLLTQLKNLINRRPNPKLDLQFIEEKVPTDKPLAYVRAQAIRQSRAEYIFMLDNDLWFHSGVFSSLERVMLKSDDNVLAVGVPPMDVVNEREYDDYDLKTYSSFREAYNHFGDCVSAVHHFYRNQCDVPFVTTHALWNRRALVESGVLSFWEGYPLGKRGYDGEGCTFAINRGYRCVMIPSDGGCCFWHLWTKKTDDGFFTRGNKYTPPEILGELGE